MTNVRSELNFTNSLLREMQRFCQRHRLIEPGAVVVAAVSGGADSLALLDLLWRWRQAGGDFILAGAHYNHQLRPEADAEQAMVEDVFQRYGVPWFIKAGDVKNRAQAERRSQHDLAREMRYTALLHGGMFLIERLFPDQRVEKAPPMILATAHHRDDQVETVLLSLFQGAGLEGLAGIRRRLEWRAGVEGVIIRPLLSLRRTDLERYCRIRGLDFATDKSNFDLSYPRNRIRHQLRPELIRQFGENAWDNLARIAEWIETENAARDLKHQAAYEDTLLEVRKKEVLLDYARFSSYLNKMQYNILRRATGQLTGRHSRIAAHRFQAALDYLADGMTGIIELGSGISVTRKGEKLYLFTLWAPIETIKVNIPGETMLPPEWGTLNIRLIEPDAVVIPAPTGKLFMDADSLVGAELWLKPARPGDRMIPLGMSGHKKISVILSELGVPAHRRTYPVLWQGEEIIVVPGLRIAEQVKVTPATRRALEITGFSH